jgi:hypothetical protein
MLIVWTPVPGQRSIKAFNAAKRRELAARRLTFAARALGVTVCADPQETFPFGSLHATLLSEWSKRASSSSS